MTETILDSPVTVKSRSSANLRQVTSRAAELPLRLQVEAHSRLIGASERQPKSGLIRELGRLPLMAASWYFLKRNGLPSPYDRAK